LCVRVTALKSVDFPTFGRPTIPVLSMTANSSSFSSSSSIFSVTDYEDEDDDDRRCVCRAA
jgi:hypothetical protein